MFSGKNKKNMKNMKQVLYVIAFGILASVPFMANAATPTGFTVPVTEGTAAGLKNATVFDLASNVMNWLLGIVGILAVIGFVISGVLYLTSAGNEEQAEKAKTIMTYSIIGLVVALIGLIVVNAVAGLTGAGNVSGY